MPRRARGEQIVPGLPHHVVLRGNNRRKLFSYEPERTLFVAMLSDAITLTGCKVHAVSLLLNHVHILITPPTGDALSSCVHHFAHRYARKRNRARNGSGKLFEERFLAKPIGDDAYLATATAYVDLNPERAFVSARARAWSTLGWHCGQPESTRIPRSLWTPSPWYLGLGACDASRGAAYLSWIAECRERDAVQQDARPADSRRLDRPDGSSAR